MTAAVIMPAIAPDDSLLDGVVAGTVALLYVRLIRNALLCVEYVSCGCTMVVVYTTSGCKNTLVSASKYDSGNTSDVFVLTFHRPRTVSGDANNSFRPKYPVGVYVNKYSQSLTLRLVPVIVIGAMARQLVSCSGDRLSHIVDVMDVILGASGGLYRLVNSRLDVTVVPADVVNSTCI